MRVLDTDERAMSIMMHEFEDEELNAFIDENVADLVSQQCEHRANELPTWYMCISRTSKT